MSYLNDDALERCKIPELKSYLRQHGQNVGGRKEELVKRAKGIKALGLQDVNCISLNDQQGHNLRTTDKLVTPLGEKMPLPSSLNNWTKDLFNIPNFTDNDVYNYLVLTMKAKRQLKSQVFFQDRHVHNVEFNNVSDECSHCYVRCKVIPSLPNSDKKDYTVWVILSKVTGNVNSADCSCTAGLGEACNHIGAMLYALVDISEKNKDGTNASTSAKSKWNNPRKRRLSPKKSKELSFRHSPYNIEKPLLKPTVNVERFRQKLLNLNSKAGWLTSFETTKDKEHTIPALNDVDFMFSDQTDLSSESAKIHFYNHFKNISYSKEQCVRIELETRGQLSNNRWMEYHKGRITSSNFGQVVMRQEFTQPDNLVKVIMGYTPFDNKYVKWGRDHEPAALRTYINIKTKSHPDLHVTPCGLYVNTIFPHLGASPDGVVHDPCCQDSSGLLEIKCPASDKWKFKSPSECAKDSAFFCTLDLHGNVILKEKHAYYFQVQGQMAITGKDWCDFVVWTLKQPTSIQRIPFNLEFWNIMVEKLNSFYLKGIIPEIYSTRVLRGRPLYHLVSDDEKEK
ncbi:hypothetical protein ACJMK2_008525 [Sinanodonta woodiana]|uniref:SWIM-type domain-containing protein n=2 Tax=Sinanodonta woodiana TaxID=1069815 RepID=A0ABD3VLV4_SINWO